MKRRKPKSQRKDALVRVRVTDEQKEMFANSALQSGLDVSSWLRLVGLKEASAVLGTEGIKDGRQGG